MNWKNDPCSHNFSQFVRKKGIKSLWRVFEQLSCCQGSLTSCYSNCTFSLPIAESFLYTLNRLWLFPIRNAVNTRLFGAYELQKIIFDLSHYTKSRLALKSGGFFAWVDEEEAKNNYRNLVRKTMKYHEFFATNNLSLLRDILSRGPCPPHHGSGGIYPPSPPVF